MVFENFGCQLGCQTGQPAIAHRLAMVIMFGFSKSISDEICEESNQNRLISTWAV